MQFWTNRADAERYARSRPYFHELVAEKIRSMLGLGEPVGLALDVGSGSGQSAMALATLARRIVALDPSRPMLQSATDAGPQRIQAVGESLPFGGMSCDLITLGLSFHWLDQERFLAEAARVLRPAAWLVIYNDYFAGQMRENPAFEEWQRSQYLARYPAPPRQSRPLSDEDAARHGMAVVERQTYSHDESFSVDELSSYLMTQTNIIAAAQSGIADVDEVRRWLLASLAELFPALRCRFVFGGFVWYLRRQ